MSNVPRREALNILRDIEERKGRIDAILDTVCAQMDMNPRDRAFVSELVYGVTRHKRALDTIIAASSDRPLGKIDPDILMLLRLGLYQAAGMSRTPVFAAVNETVELAKSDPATRRAARFMNGVLRGGLRKIEAAGAAESIPEIVRCFIKKGEPDTRRLGRMYSFPDWIARRWIGAFGVERAERIMAACAAKAPVFLRVNTLKTTDEECVERLARSGVTARPVAWGAGLLKISEGTLPLDSPVIADGLVQPQDGASFLAASLLDPAHGTTAADVCCGKGIKSGLLAQTVGESGCIVCFDTHPAALAALKENMKRMGVTICAPALCDAAAPWPTAQKFDSVFLDAPCSGTGLFRRRPEGKWNKDERLIHDMATLQAAMLSRAVDHLAAGGALVYAVCSIEPEEGAEQIERLLAGHPEIRRADVKSGRPELRDFINDDGDLFILPGAEGMDGFYAAKLLLS